MANLLQDGVAWLVGQLQSDVSDTIIYSRGALSLTCKATLGRKLLRTQDGNGQTRIEVTDADFLIRTSDLVLEGLPIEPERGDQILLDGATIRSLYEVAPYSDEPPFRWSDSQKDRLLCRVHAKLISQEPYVTPATTPAPTMTAATPGTGTTAGGTAVTITGTGFWATDLTQVFFGTAAATAVVVVSATSITCVSPAHASGSVAVTVTNPDGQSAALAGGFTYS